MPPLLLFVACLAFGLCAGDATSRAESVAPMQVALVNAASYETVVAPGSLGALFGANLTTQTQIAGTLPLPTSMGGVAVKIAGKPAPLLFVSPSQINLQVPSGIGAGMATIEVFSDNGTTPISAGTAMVDDAAPGVFTVDSTGRGQASALNSDYSSNGSFDLLPGARPEVTGGYVSIFATGIGATSPLVPDGQAAPDSPPVTGVGDTTVTIGGVQAQVLFSGLAPGFVGLWQINVVLPANLPTNLTAALRVTKSRAGNETTLAIAGPDEYATISGAVKDGLSGGALRNATVTLEQPGQPTRTTNSDALGTFVFQIVRAGSYNLQAASTGFLAEVQSITATDGQTATATLTLAKQKPNIVFIVADDLGYADLGVQGSADIVTPNIDSLALNGVRFTDGYVSSPVCAPTRAGFLTGRYQQRFGLELLPGEGDTDYGLSLNETTLANRLQALGYATGMVGKWHLGTQSQFAPQQRGFDEFFGFLIGMHSYTNWNQPNNPILRGTQPVIENTYLTDAFAREAVDFIERNRQQPFFCYVPFNAPHDPLSATQSYLARFPNITDPNRRIFAAMMAALDDGVGNILAKLREHALEENTLIIFLSDNGGIPRVNTSKNDPFSGQKDQLLEGGIRIPFLMQWKGYLPEGAVNSAPVIALDVLPTAVAAALGRTFTDVSLDGVNLIPFLTGAETALPHDNLFWRSGQTQYAVRAGDWKLLFFQNSTRLYNLATDPAETTNAASSNPTKFNELKAIYDQWNAQLPPAPQ